MELMLDTNRNVDMESYLRERRMDDLSFKITFWGMHDGIKLAEFDDPKEVVEFVGHFKSIFLAKERIINHDTLDYEEVPDHHEVDSWRSYFTLVIDGFVPDTEQYEYDIYILFGDKFYGTKNVIGDLTR